MMRRTKFPNRPSADVIDYKQARRKLVQKRKRAEWKRRKAQRAQQQEGKHVTPERYSIFFCLRFREHMFLHEFDFLQTIVYHLERDEELPWEKRQALYTLIGRIVFETLFPEFMENDQNSSDPAG